MPNGVTSSIYGNNISRWSICRHGEQGCKRKIAKALYASNKRGYVQLHHHHKINFQTRKMDSTTLFLMFLCPKNMYDMLAFGVRLHQIPSMQKNDRFGSIQSIFEFNPKRRKKEREPPLGWLRPIQPKLSRFSSMERPRAKGAVVLSPSMRCKDKRSKRVLLCRV